MLVGLLLAAACGSTATAAKDAGKDTGPHETGPRDAAADGGCPQPAPLWPCPAGCSNQYVLPKCEGTTWVNTVDCGACLAHLPDAAREAAPPPADGPFACGAATCAATQFCLHPCSGVALSAMCVAGMTCPAGSSPTSETCDGGLVCGENGPTPSCVDSPPCVAAPDSCIVDGRDYTETGCG